MTNENNTQQEMQGGGVTLGHLLLAISFVSPIAAVETEVHRAGGGMLRYSLGFFVSFGLAVLIVWACWSGGRLLWLRSQHHSERAQNFLAFGMYGLYFLSIVVGDIAGYRLAALLIHHVG
jgi:hypothetical protein